MTTMVSTLWLATTGPSSELHMGFKLLRSVGIHPINATLIQDAFHRSISEEITSDDDFALRIMKLGQYRLSAIY